MTSSIYSGHPAAFGGVVTQGHANYCASQGHASWIANGVDTGFCSRCGVLVPAKIDEA